MDWKKAKVVPICTKGVKSDPGNYRPISLTSIVCKVLESLVWDEIIKHVSANNLLSNVQHGFLPKRSCMSQLLTAMEFWTDKKSKMVIQLILFMLTLRKPLIKCLMRDSYVS